MIEIFNPIHVLVNQCSKMFPQIKAEIYFDDELDSLGKTVIPEDGSTPIIYINAKNNIKQCLDVIAHEIAHILEPDDEHGIKWEKAYDYINKEWLNEHSCD